MFCPMLRKATRDECIQWGHAIVSSKVYHNIAPLSVEAQDICCKDIVVENKRNRCPLVRKAVKVKGIEGDFAIIRGSS